MGPKLGVGERTFEVIAGLPNCIVEEHAASAKGAPFVISAATQTSTCTLGMVPRTPVRPIGEG
jgi:hypothetical protein